MSDKQSNQQNPSQKPDQARSQPGQNPGMPGKGPEGDERANNPPQRDQDKSRADRDTAVGGADK